MWRATLEGWEIGPDGLPLLRAALEMWDLYSKARKVVKREGPTIVNPESGVIRMHPAAAVACRALSEFRQCWRQLGLDPEAMGRPK